MTSWLKKVRQSGRTLTPSVPSNFLGSGSYLMVPNTSPVNTSIQSESHLFIQDGPETQMFVSILLENYFWQAFCQPGLSPQLLRWELTPWAF